MLECRVCKHDSVHLHAIEHRENQRFFLKYERRQHVKRRSVVIVSALIRIPGVALLAAMPIRLPVRSTTALPAPMSGSVVRIPASFTPATMPVAAAPSPAIASAVCPIFKSFDGIKRGAVTF